MLAQALSHVRWCSAHLAPLQIAHKLRSKTAFIPCIFCSKGIFLDTQKKKNHKYFTLSLTLPTFALTIFCPTLRIIKQQKHETLSEKQGVFQSHKNREFFRGKIPSCVTLLGSRKANWSSPSTFVAQSLGEETTKPGEL